MMKVIKSIIMKVCSCIKQLFKPNEKAPIVNVNITISSSDNNKIDVSFNQK